MDPIAWSDNNGRYAAASNPSWWCSGEGVAKGWSEVGVPVGKGSTLPRTRRNMLDRNQLPYDERKREASWGTALYSVSVIQKSRGG